MSEKNIFDSSAFDPNQVYWMLRNPAHYRDLLAIYRRRNYFDSTVWSFSILHEDPQAFAELTLREPQSGMSDPQIFEYFPLSSNRAHKFMNQEKSTILNREFKETYRNFLIAIFMAGGATSDKQLLTFSYYLLLQDRVQDAARIFARVKKVRYISI